MRYTACFCLVALVILVTGSPLAAQFLLSGKVHSSQPDELLINIPFVFGNYEQNNIPIPVNADGSFEARLPLTKEKFALLYYGKQGHCLYLRPGESLSITIDSTGKNLKPTGGSLFYENQIIRQSQLYEYPAFLKQRLSKDSIQLLKQQAATAIFAAYIRPWLDYCQQKEALVEHSDLPGPTKQLFIQEMRANARCRALEFGWTFMSQSQLRTFYPLLFSDISPLPLIDEPGAMYYMFVRYYVNFLEADAMDKMKTRQLKSTDPLPYYHISLDSGQVMMNTISKAYINWLAVKNTNTAFVAESFLAQQVFAALQEKDINSLRGLIATLKATYPQSRYYPELKAGADKLEALLRQNQSNADIRIFDNYQKLQSIQEVIHTLKGNVVYLDVWGTWCGPCKQELKYVPALKAHFKNKAVTFVYLDMDEDEKDADWKDFIKVNGLTGLHLRKNRIEIEALWKELLENDPDKAMYYPRFFIFDKNGKLVNANAKRPSEGKALYLQIEAVLNQ